MNYSKYHRPNFCYLSSRAEGLKKGLWFFFYLKYCKTILSMTAHASCCILNTFWPIITKNVLHSTYFTTDLYHRMTHMATSPPAPVVVISNVIVSFLKDNWSTGGGFYFPFDADRLLLPASMKLHRSMESWHPPGLFFSQNANRMLGWLRRSRLREVSLPPAPLLSTGGATPGAPSTNLTWMCWNGSMEGIFRRWGWGGWDWGPGQRESPGGIWSMCIKTWQGGIKTVKAFLSAHWKDNR